MPLRSGLKLKLKDKEVQMFKFIKANIALTVSMLGLLIAMAGLVFTLLFFQKDNNRLFTELVGQQTKYKQLKEHSARLGTLYVDRGVLMRKLESEWADEKSELKGRVKILSNATFLIREKARETNNSDLVYQGKKHKYIYNELKFLKGPPLGYILIFDDGRVTSKIFNHVIDVKTAISRDESTGHYSVVSKADYILKSPSLQKDGVNWINKPYPLKITGGIATIDPTEPLYVVRKGFKWWAPVINGGFNIGSTLKPAFGMSFAGYGISRRDLDWKFLHFGVDYSGNTNAGIHAIPFLYRPFPKYFQNTYIGPGVGFDTKGLNFFGAISVGF